MPLAVIAARRNLTWPGPNGLSAVLSQQVAWLRRRAWDVVTLGIDAAPSNVPDLELASDLFERFYHDICCRDIWPVLHGHARVKTTSAEEVLSNVGQLLAEHILTESSATPDMIWLHDFHVAAAARSLREAGYGGRLGYFQHAPIWTCSESSITKFVASSVSFADLVGVQTQKDAEALLAHGLSDTQLVVAPVTVALPDQGSTTDNVPEPRTVLVLARCDPTKGHADLLRAVESLTELPDELVVVASPSRTGLSESIELRLELAALAKRLANRFRTEGKHLEVLFEEVEVEDVKVLMQRTETLVVPSMADGMNLVSKEFVSNDLRSCRTVLLRPGVGSRYSLPGALVVGDNSVGALARGLESALRMPAAERRNRARQNRRSLQDETSDGWCERLEIGERQD